MSSIGEQPAFPTRQTTSSGHFEWIGLTKREWFAGRETLNDLDDYTGQALRKISEALGGPMPEIHDIDAMIAWENRWRAKLKVMRADALITALEKEAGK